MTRVTFCAHDFPNFIGGPVSWYPRLLRALRSRGVDCRMLFFTQPGYCATLETLRAEGFDCPSVHWPDSTERQIRWILGQLRERETDVFVPNLSVSGYFAGRWVREAGIPTVGLLHSDDAFYRGLQSEFVSGRRHNRVSAMVCVSAALEKEVLDRHPVGVRIHRIPYGAPIPIHTCPPPVGVLRLAYVGRLVEEQKQISAVTRAFCRVSSAMPDAECDIIGDGRARDHVASIIEREGQGLSVRLMGRVDSEKVQERLLAYHVFVLLSDYEGIPIALMEAMACGLVPVCLNTRSGVSELVEHGVTGLLVNDREDGFVDAVRRLRHEPGLWQRLSVAARAKIEADFSSELCADRWAQMFLELHRGSPRRRPIRSPRFLQLPPVHPGLACEDHRQIPAHRRAAHQARRLAGRVKRALPVSWTGMNNKGV